MANNKWNSTTLVDNNFTKDGINKALLDLLAKINTTYSTFSTIIFKAFASSITVVTNTPINFPITSVVSNEGGGQYSNGIYSVGSPGWYQVTAGASPTISGQSISAFVSLNGNLNSTFSNPYLLFQDVNIGTPTDILYLTGTTFVKCKQGDTLSLILSGAPTQTFGGLNLTIIKV